MSNEAKVAYRGPLCEDLAGLVFSFGDLRRSSRWSIVLLPIGFCKLRPPVQLDHRTETVNSDLAP